MLVFVVSALAADPPPNEPPKAPTFSLTSKGWTLADAAGANTLSFSLSLQPRFTATLSGDPEATDDAASSDVGVRIRRMLFVASGTIATRLEYRFRINAANAFSFTDADGKTQSASKPILDDAQVTYWAHDAFGLSIGQWKVPFTESQAQSDTSLLSIDRSFATEGYRNGDAKFDAIAWGRDAGVAVLGNVAGKRLEYGVGVFNGDGQNVWPNDGGFLYAGRVQVAPLGEVKHDEVDFSRGKPRLAIGASGSYNSHPVYDKEGAATDPTTTLRVGGDVRFLVAGLSVGGEVLYVQDAAGGEAAGPRLGAYAYAGYYLPVGIAPAVRWSMGDQDMEASGDQLQQIEGTLNWYLPDPTKKGANLGHKAQVQLGWATTLLEGADHPLAHQVQLATAFGF